MPDSPTFAEQMVTKLEAALLANAGIKSTNFDGTAITFDELTDRYNYWKSVVAKEQGTRRFIAPIVMEGGV